MSNNFVEESKRMSDDELIKGISSGNYENLQPLIDRYMPYIIKTADGFKASGCDVEDMIAEGVLAVFTAVKSYDSSKAKFSTFVPLCISRAISAMSKSAAAGKRIPSRLIAPLEEADVYGEDSPEEIYIGKESYESFKRNVFSSLSDMECRVLSEFLSGKPYADIAEELGVSVKSVDNSLRRIRAKLKKQ